MRGLRRLVSDSSQTEQGWIELSKAGDRAAFDCLVRMHFERIYSRLFRLVGNHEDAEDLTQEAFVRAYHALEHFRSGGPFAGWLTRIAVHLARDRARARRVRGEDQSLVAVDIPNDASGGPSQSLSQREFKHQILCALERLPFHLRTALTLRVSEGLSYAEIADAMGLQPGTIRTHVMKARRMLLHFLASQLDGDQGGRKGGPSA